MQKILLLISCVITNGFDLIGFMIQNFLIVFTSECIYIYIRRWGQIHTWFIVREGVPYARFPSAFIPRSFYLKPCKKKYVMEKYGKRLVANILQEIVVRDLVGRWGSTKGETRREAGPPKNSASRNSFRFFHHSRRSSSPAPSERANYWNCSSLPLVESSWDLGGHLGIKRRKKLLAQTFRRFGSNVGFCWEWEAKKLCHCFNIRVE